MNVEETLLCVFANLREQLCRPEAYGTVLYWIWKWYHWRRAAHCLVPCCPRSNRLTSHRSKAFFSDQWRKGRQMTRRDERLILLLASDRLKRNFVTHSLGVFNHCQLNEAYSHVRRFTEFVWCDSEHETTPTLSNLGICVLWRLIIGMLMDGCYQIRLG